MVLVAVLCAANVIGLVQLQGLKGCWKMGRICFFSGHSDVGENIYPALLEAVERHITNLGQA